MNKKSNQSNKKYYKIRPKIILKIKKIRDTWTSNIYGAEVMIAAEKKSLIWALEGGRARISRRQDERMKDERWTISSLLRAALSIKKKRALRCENYNNILLKNL